MKRSFGIILAILLVLAMFAGCAQKTVEPEQAGPGRRNNRPAGRGVPANSGG